VSQPVSIDVPHNLGAAEARRRIEGNLDRLGGKLPAGVEARPVWEGDRLRLDLSMMGQHIDAGLDIQDTLIRITIMLPPARENASWSQPGGIASNAPGHLAFSGATKSAWTADIGKGSSFYGRLTASPIVYEDKVYTLDAAGQVSAFGISGGAPVWRASTTPPSEKDQEGFGGGLAADGGRIYAATGYGYLEACCLGCNTHQTIALDIIRRPKTTIWSDTCVAKYVLRAAVYLQT